MKSSHEFPRFLIVATAIRRARVADCVEEMRRDIDARGLTDSLAGWLFGSSPTIHSSTHLYHLLQSTSHTLVLCGEIGTRRRRREHVPFAPHHLTPPQHTPSTRSPFLCSCLLRRRRRRRRCSTLTFFLSYYAVSCFRMCKQKNTHTAHDRPNERTQ